MDIPWKDHGTRHRKMPYIKVTAAMVVLRKLESRLMACL
jgi:hypothetical protein